MSDERTGELAFHIPPDERAGPRATGCPYLTRAYTLGIAHSYAIASAPSEQRTRHFTNSLSALLLQKQLTQSLQGLSSRALHENMKSQGLGAEVARENSDETDNVLVT